MSTRLWRFEFSTSVTYTIEVGHDGSTGYFRFYALGGQVQDSGGAYQLSSPYAAADIALLYPKQINDVVYICHPDYPVGKLSRVSNAVWTYEVVAFDTVPVLDENITDTTIQVSDYTGTINLEASAAIFDPLHVGSFWRIGHKRSVGMIEAFITSNFETFDDIIFGVFNVRTYGTWAADIVLQRESNVVGTWEEVARWRSNSDRNIDAEHEAVELGRYRISIQNWASSTDGRVVLEWGGAIIYGTVKILTVGSSGTTATALVTEDLYQERDTDIAYALTPYWAEGAWSELRGYPRAVTCHEQRLIFGGTYHQPAGLWGSVTGDFENFLYGSDDDDAWFFLLAADETNTIQWLESLGVLAVGTTGGEWRGRGNDLGDAITPTRRDFKQRTFHGSEYMPAIKVGDATVLFLERKGRKIRELFVEGDTFATAELTLLADHVTLGRVSQMAWQRDNRILWIVNGNGELWGLTYDREQQVAGWHGPHTTEGDFLSVATAYGQADQEDEVWFIVRRAVGSSLVDLVERFNPELWTEIEDAYFVDSGLTYEGSPETDFTGLSHIAGMSIVGLADGVPFAATVGVDGSFSLPSGMAAASKVHAGLAYTSEMAPFRLDVDAGGIYAGKVRRIDDVKLRVLNTAGGYYKKPDDATARALEYVSPRLGTGTLKNGDVPTGYKSGHEYDPTIIIRQTQPLPMTLLAMIVASEIE